MADLNQITVSVNDIIPPDNFATVDAGTKNGTVYTKEQDNAWRKEVEAATQSGIKGQATPSTIPTPWVSGQPDLYEKYDVKESGTFTNFKDSGNNPIVISSVDLNENLVQLWVKNGVSEKILKSLPKATQFIPPFTGSVFPLVSTTSNPIQRTHNNSIWQLKDDETSLITDIPGETDIWKKIGPSFSAEKSIGKNIANPALRVVGKYVNASGDLVTLAGAESIVGVPCSPGIQQVISGASTDGSSKYLVWKDINGVKLANPNVSLSPSPKIITPPAGAKSYDATIKWAANAPVTQLQIEVGSVASAYEPYTETEIIKEIDNKNLLASYFPDYVSGTYKKNQIFVYSDKIYKSKVNNNTALPTDATKWVNIGGGGSGGSSYDQSLNTTDAVQFSKVTAGEFAVPGTLKKGTLVTPPSGLISGEYWLDQTDSTTNPIIRQKQ